MKQKNYKQAPKVVPIRKLAPAPRRGNQKRVFDVLLDMGDWTPRPMVSQYVAGILHSDKQSKETAISVALEGLVRDCRVNWMTTGRTTKAYKVALEEEYLRRTEKKKARVKSATPKRGGVKFTSFDELAEPTSSKFKVSLTVQIALIAFSVMCVGIAYRAIVG